MEKVQFIKAMLKLSGKITTLVILIFKKHFNHHKSNKRTKKSKNKTKIISIILSIIHELIVVFQFIETSSFQNLNFKIIQFSYFIIDILAKICLK